MLYIIFAILSAFTEKYPTIELLAGFDERYIIQKKDTTDIFMIQRNINLQKKYMELENYKSSNPILEDVKKNYIVKDVLNLDEIKTFQMNSGGLLDEWNNEINIF
jgi:hypothetical protein